jgi:N-methylhydantoinase A
VNLHSAVVGRRPPVPLGVLAGRGDGEDPLLGRRRVRFGGAWEETPVLDRARLGTGSELTGPAIVQQLDTTTVIEPGDRLTVDPLGNLLIEVRP